MGTFTGTLANETITPASVSPTVVGTGRPSAAADTINGGGGSDDLNGGGGNDTVAVDFWTKDPYTFTGTSTLRGGSGNDRLYVLLEGPNLDVDNGTFRLYGGSGNDRLEATYYYPWSQGPNYGAAKDFLYGGTGSDTYVLQERTDVVVERAGEGYDTVLGWGDDYTLAANVEKLQLFYGDDDAPQGYRGTGNDLANVIIGTAANDTLLGGGGDDTIFGKAAGENLDGNDDADVIRGGSGNDTIYGGSGNGESWDGDDVIYGDGGNDRIFGSFGNDRMYGGTGNDEMGGQAGDDAMYGGGGNDRLGGGSGNDSLFGGGGADRLSGRDDADQLTGGAGNDIFDYDAVTDSSPGASRDVILDFVGVGAAVGDRIDLSTIDANSGAGGNQAFVFRGTAGFTGAGQVRVTASGADTLVQANTGGSRAPELEILVKDGGADPSSWIAGDFIL